MQMSAPRASHDQVGEAVARVDAVLAAPAEERSSFHR
jgi:hypothetical protein